MSKPKDVCTATKCEWHSDGHCDYERVNACVRPCLPDIDCHFNPSQKPRAKSDEMQARMRLYEQGLTDAEIAEALGARSGAVTEWRKKRGLPANRKKREVTRIKDRLALYEQGLTDAEIAEHEGVTRMAIVQWRFKRGLEPNKSKQSAKRTREEKTMDKTTEIRPVMTAEGLLKVLTNAPLDAAVKCSQCQEGFTVAKISDEYGPDGERREAVVWLGR